VDLIRLGIGLAAVVAIAGIYHTGHKAGSNAVSVEWEKDKLARIQALLDQEVEYRAKEQKWGESLKHIIDAERAAQEATRHELETIIADRESGALQLRDRFRGCQKQLSEATTAASGTDGGSEGGLSSADEKFLVRIGAECDATAGKLTALQRYVVRICLDGGR